MSSGGWRQARRLLAVRLDNLGDVIMLGPALRSLKARLPASRITLLASPGGVAAAGLLPWVDDVIAHRALWQELGSPPLEPRPERELIELLAAGRFDGALIFTSFSQSPHAAGYACHLAGIPLRAGASKEFGGAVLTHELRLGPEHDGLHQVDRNLALLDYLGFEPVDRRLGVRIPTANVSGLDRLLVERGLDPDQPVIVACPWASCPARTYSPAAMVEAALAIGASTGRQVALAGLARHLQESRSLVARLGDRGIDLVGRLGFGELAALIRRAALVLTNNSGPLHLAEATGTPAVVLFAGTELESQWGPRFTRSRLLRRPTPCQPCYASDCPIYGHPCLAIPADEVAAAGLELLAARSDAATA